MSTRRRSTAGLTVVESLLAVAILGLLAALAVPRFQQPRQEGKLAQLVSGVSVLRTAIESYWSQHDEFPGQQGAGQFADQLTKPTNRSGRVGAGVGFGYGPYLRRDSLPRHPFSNDGALKVVDRMPQHPTGDSAWIYDRTTGEVRPNTTAVMPDGVRLFDL